MDQPTSVSTTYDPSDHLVTLKTVSGPKAHYPFCWQQHEFRLRYPNGVIDAQIIQVDIERDLVIVKVVAKADDLGNCIGVGLHCGSLTTINQVLERAKSQALADLGIGSTWPTVFDDDLDRLEVVAPAPAAPQEETSIISNASSTAAGFTHHPARTTATVQAFYAKVYKVQPQEIDGKWAKFVLGICGRPLAKGPLSEDELNKINGVISQYYQRTHGACEQQQASTTSARKAS